MFDNLLMSMNSKLKKIMSGLETNEGKIDEISTNTVINNTASKTGILSSKLAYIISLLENTNYGLSALKTASTASVSCVRKIQTGIISMGNSTEKTVTISGFSDKSKMIVVPMFFDEANGYITIDSTTQLTLHAANYATGRYQVIEFY